MEKCQQCDTEYETLGLHWSKSGQCDYPEWSNESHEIAAGLLMGDAYLSTANKNPRIEVKMITPEYLRHVDNIFDSQGTGVRHYMTAEQSAEQAVSNGLRPKAEAENYNDVWRWNTISTPELDRYRDWYDGGKVWPDDIDLTPTTLKHWYVGDGHLEVRGNSKRMSIGASNEMERFDKVLAYFDAAGLPKPAINGSNLRWNVDGTEQLFDYMGEPLPGFDNKWP